MSALALSKIALSLSPTAAISIPMLLCFFGLMIGVGLACRKHSTNVDGFVLGGRSVGPWLTAFAFGTSYFRRLSLWDMQDNSAGISVFPPLGSVWATPLSARCWPGRCWDAAPV